MVMRALGVRTPPGFWLNQRYGAYRKEFGDAAIERQKAVLRHKFGAALYDRESARSLPRFPPSAPPRPVPTRALATPPGRYRGTSH
jgi:hypothetical protein